MRLGGRSAHADDALDMSAIWRPVERGDPEPTGLAINQRGELCV